MCRAHRSIHRRPQPIPTELQQALQASVLLTLNRRATARTDEATMNSNLTGDHRKDNDAPEGLGHHLPNALGPGDKEVDVLLGRLREARQEPMPTRRDE